MTSPGPVIDEFGICTWYKDGKLHRDGDLPAVVYPNGGGQQWFTDGKLHRDGDMPAIMWPNKGGKRWYKDGKLHRDGDLPAMMFPDGRQVWFKDDKIHRDLGPSLILCLNLPKFYEHGVSRSVRVIQGETVVEYPSTSWSPVLCFI